VLWTGQLITMTGRQLTVVAVPYQVYVATHNNLAVGLLGLAQVVPLLAAGLYAGVIADRFDRRRVLLASLSVQLLAAACLALLAIRGNAPLWTLYAVTAAAAAVTTLEHAARAATIPRLVGTRRLASALSIYQLLIQSAQVVGPAAAGLVIGHFGLRWAYGIDAACYAAALGFVGRMAAQPMGAGKPVSMGLRSPIEGLAYAWRQPALLACFAIDLNAMIFGMPRALFPALASSSFHTGPQGMGLLYAAPGAGALVASVLSGWVRHARRQGLFVIFAVAGWGLAITVFGLSGRHFALALVMLAIAGAFDMVSAVFRPAIVQLATPDRLRGRLSALNSMVVTSGPRLGDLESGVVAALTTPVISVVSGGLACLVGTGLIAVLLPALRRQRLGSAVELAENAEVVESG
jgi:MFS family permease